MAKKAAKGMGTIRKKTVKRGDKEYTYFEARVTTGRDPGTGKQIPAQLHRQKPKGSGPKAQSGDGGRGCRNLYGAV